MRDAYKEAVAKQEALRQKQAAWHPQEFYIGDWVAHKDYGVIVVSQVKDTYWSADAGSHFYKVAFTSGDPPSYRWVPGERLRFVDPDNEEDAPFPDDEPDWDDFDYWDDFPVTDEDDASDNKDYEAPPSEEADDAINPAHYKSGGVECIDAMVWAFGKQAVIAFCRCNEFKYRWRAGQKNGEPKERDLDKAQWYHMMLLHLEVGATDPREVNFL